MNEAANYANKNKQIKEYRSMFYTCCSCNRVSCEHVGIFPLSSSVGLNLVPVFVLESPQKLLTLLLEGWRGSDFGVYKFFALQKRNTWWESSDHFCHASYRAKTGWANSLKWVFKFDILQDAGWIDRFVQTSFLMNPWNILFPVVQPPPWQILVFGRHIAHLLSSTFLFYPVSLGECVAGPLPPPSFLQSQTSKFDFLSWSQASVTFAPILAFISLSSLFARHLVSIGSQPPPPLLQSGTTLSSLACRLDLLPIGVTHGCQRGAVRSTLDC